MPTPRSATASRTASCTPSAHATLSASPCSATSKPSAAKQLGQLARAVVDDDDEPLESPRRSSLSAPGPHDRAAAEDHDGVADPLGLLEVVGRDHDVHPELGADPPDQREHVVALERVEPVGRLVEEDELGVVDDRAGELHALPLAGRHRADRPEPLLAEADLPERVVRALDRGPARGGRAARRGAGRDRPRARLAGDCGAPARSRSAPAPRCRTSPDRGRARSARRRRGCGGRARAR